jgi:ATP-dependent Clp protease adaptor protein ClpS
MGQTLTEPGTVVEILEGKAPLYNVILLNDDDHSYDYVIEMLQKIFCFSKEEALKHAVEVDLTGRTTLITCGLAEAEYSRNQVHAYGPDPRISHCHGSMTAVIELADTPPS